MRDVDRASGAHAGYGRTVWPCRRENDRLVARVQHRTNRDVECLDSRGRDHNVPGGIEGYPVQLVVLARDCLSQGRQTCVFGVKGIAVLKRPYGRILYILRCW